MTKKQELCVNRLLAEGYLRYDEHGGDMILMRPERKGANGRAYEGEFMLCVSVNKNGTIINYTGDL